jgi:hypothetical protein
MIFAVETGFAPKVLEPCADFSRKAAKPQSAAAFQQFSLRLCVGISFGALAAEM